MFDRRSRMPAMQDLVAFEAAGRLGSFTEAAQELALTQGAVSRQVASLEEILGTPLFRRSHRRVTLTDAGRLYLIEVAALLSRLSEATERLSTFGAADVINLAVLPTFASRWLIPRLPRFCAIAPTVTVNCMSRSEKFDFDREPFDASVHFGEDDWQGATATFLCGEVSVAVAAPGFALDRADATRLYLSSRPDAWDLWQAAQGQAPSGREGPRFDQFAMLVEAAAAGLGAAVIPRFIVENDLASGRLVEITAALVRDRRSYWLMRPADRLPSPALVAFTDWLQREASLPQARASA